MSDRQHYGDNIRHSGKGDITTGARTQTFGDNSPIGSPIGQAAPAGGSRPRTHRSRNVFVVHGRDEQVRREMFALLRRLDLHPLEWEDLVRATGKATPYLGEVVANAPSQAQAAMVLLTPDDVAKLHPQLLDEDEPDYETQLTCQPRQNVLIELGMVLMAYPERTLIVEVGRLRHVSDTAGLNVIRFDGSATALGKVVERLKQAECQVNDTGSDWRDTAPFEHLAAYRRQV